MFVMYGPAANCGCASAAVSPLIEIGALSSARHNEQPLWDQRPGLFFLVRWRSASPLVHAGASLAGNDSAPASATGSNTGDVLFCSSRTFGLRFVGMRVSLCPNEPGPCIPGGRSGSRCQACVSRLRTVRCNSCCLPLPCRSTMDARICSLFLEPYQPSLARSYLSKVDRSLVIRCTCCPEGAAASRSSRSNSHELERTDVAGKR